MIMNKSFSVIKNFSLVKPGLSNTKVVSRNAYRWPPLKNPINTGPNAHLPFKVATLDDVPVPMEDFQQFYKRKNKLYNMHLAFGIFWFSLPVMYFIIYQPVFFNAFEPPMPPKEERIKSFWSPEEDDE